MIWGRGASKYVGRYKAWCITTTGAASLEALTKHLTKEEAFVLARGLREYIVRHGREGTAVGAWGNWLHVRRSSARKQG